MLEHALALAADGFEVFPLHHLLSPAPKAFERALRDSRLVGDPEEKKRIWKAAVLKADCACGKSDCTSPGKHPHVSWKEATADEATVRGWWSRWPNANIGIRVPKGVVVVDFDWKTPAAAQSYAALEPLLPKTRRAETGNGVHIWLRANPADAPDSRFPGGDIIHHGLRYVVAPPSTHWSGNTYRWTSVDPIAEASAELLAALRGESAAAAPGLDLDGPDAQWRPRRRPPWLSPADYALEICRKAAPARDANGADPGPEHGSQTVQRVANWLVVGLELTPDLALELMAAHYAPRCLPPFDSGDPDFERLVLTAGRDGDPGYLAPTLESARQWKARAKAERDAAKVALTRTKRVAAAEETGAAHAAYQEAKRAYELADERLAQSRAVESELQAATPGTPGAVARILAGTDLDLRINDKGKPLNDSVNLEAVLRHLGAGVFGLDLLSSRPHVLRPIEPIPPGPWRDVHAFRLKAWILATFGFEPTTAAVEEAVASVADDNAFHPVADYLSGLEWDGQARLDGLLPRYFGAEDTEYHRSVGRKWLVSCVARAAEPGCKVDTMPVLEGLQGARKSLAVATLASLPWFSDTAIDLRNIPEACKQLQGVWIYEIAELDGFRRADLLRVKNFASRQQDNFRQSYARRAESYPRTCVFVGTTNERRYLQDPTGNRRFWPVACDYVDVPALRVDRDQLWAEAAAAYVQHVAEQDGDPLRYTPNAWWFERDTEAEIVRPEQEERQEDNTDPWGAMLRAWLEELDPGETFSTADALRAAVHLVPSQIDHRAAVRAGTILSHCPNIKRKRTAEGMVYVKESEPQI